MVRTTSTLLSVAATVVTISNAFGAATTVNQSYSGTFPTTLSGTLDNQNTVLLESLTLPSTSSFTATSTSYASTSENGFSPNLILFNPAGVGVAASIPFGSVNSNTGIIGDSRLTASNLAAGTYTLAISDVFLNQSITATNLSDGFDSNFGNGTTFIDTNGNLRTGAYSVNVSATAVPEPGMLTLAVTFAGIVASTVRRRRTNP